MEIRPVVVVIVRVKAQITSWLKLVHTAMLRNTIEIKIKDRKNFSPLKQAVLIITFKLMLCNQRVGFLYDVSKT